MKRAIAGMIMLTAIIALCAAARAEQGGETPWPTLFDYDASQPLLEDLKLMHEMPQYRQYHLSFYSANGQRVTALYYEPIKARKPFPAIVCVHGAAGSKEDIKIAYDFFATRGFAVLAIDAALHGERAVEHINALRADWYTLRHIYAQTVLDLRRAVDWLETRPAVDPSRIGYFGVSMGTIIGSTFCGVDKRIAAAALIIGGADFHLFLRHSQLPGIVILRNYATEAELDAVADSLAPVDPQYFVGRIAPRPAMFMNGRQDYAISPEAGARLQDLAGEPKETYWYDGGHLPPFDQVMLRTANFFKKHLKKSGENPAAPKAAPAAPAPDIRVSIKRDFTDPGHRIVDISASTAKPLPPGASLALFFPLLPQRNLPLYDDGTHGDAKAADGVWSFRFILGPHPQELEIVGGEKMYEAAIRALDANGAVLSEVGAGIITREPAAGRQ